MVGTGMEVLGDAMQGHWGDALMGAGMLGLQFVGGKLLGKLGGEAEGEAGALEHDAEGGVGAEARTAEGSTPATKDGDPVDVVSGWMLTEATDVDLPGVLPLLLRRSYASGYATGRLFGPGWSSTLDQRLAVNEAGVHFVGDDSERLDYPLPVGDTAVLPERGHRWPLVWDRQTDELRITDPWSGRTHHFSQVHYQDEFGQIRDLTAITDRNGNAIRVVRNEQGTPLMVEHAGYRIAVDSTATAAGPRVSGLRLLDDLAGTESGSGTELRRFGYDQRGRLTEVVNSSGRPFRYEWDEQNRITAWEDRSGYRYSYFYDAVGRVVRGEGGFQSGAFSYDPKNRTTVATDSLGYQTTYRYDQYGHVCAETDPLGNTKLTETDRYGRVLSRTDARGVATRYEWDERGDLRQVIAGDGGLTALDYNDLHQAVLVTHPDGAVWRREYDDRGNLTAVTDPAGAVTRYQYADNGALTVATDALGATTLLEPDAAGLALVVRDATGSVTRNVRDAAGRVLSLIDPLGAVTAFTWDAEGQPLTRLTPDGALTQWEYDASGRLVKAVSPLGAATVYEPGPLGTVRSSVRPDGVRHTFAYDTELRLTGVTTAAGATWDFAYDPAGRLIGETDFIGRAVGYEYDAAGQLAARVTGTGERIVLERDAAGRITRRQTPEGEFGYAYDPAGRLLRATGPGTVLEYERDALGRVLAESVDGRTMRHGYDAVGRRTSRTTGSGVESVWDYDGAGQPLALHAGAGRLEFTLDAAGRETGRTFSAQARLTRQFDAAGRPVFQSVGVDGRDGSGSDSEQTTLSRSWTWRADGVPEEIHDSLRGTRRIVSDSSGRPTAVTAQGWNETYAYDAFGNLTSGVGSVDGSEGEAPVGGGVGPAAEPTVATKTLIRQAGRTQYDYDAAGRLTRTVRRTLDGRQKTWVYTWDSQDRLVQVDTPDHGTWRYSYDPKGRRTGKHRVGADGAVTEQTLFTWDGSRVAEQWTPRPDGGAVTLTWDYEPGSFRPAAQRRRTWADGAGQDAIDEAFHAIITDLVGAPTELLGPDGRVAWHTSTTLWGRTIETSAEAGVTCPLRFPGQYHDDETGLYYNLNRYYSPETAAYLTPDPLGLAPAPNDHAYVTNPLTYADPLGLYEDALGNKIEMGDDVGDYTHDPGEVHDQIINVINHWDKHGTRPEGVQFGGGPEGVYRGHGMPKEAQGMDEGYYHESDIFPTGEGESRPSTGRLVFGDKGEVWFTPHYKPGSWTKLRDAIRD
jgi:RHS repeat-associated protein